MIGLVIGLGLMLLDRYVLSELWSPLPAAALLVALLARAYGRRAVIERVTNRLWKKYHNRSLALLATRPALLLACQARRSPVVITDAYFTHIPKYSPASVTN